MNEIKEELDKSRYLQAVFQLSEGTELCTACYLDEHNRVVITEEIMERFIKERNRIEKETNEKGRNAREVIRSLDELRSRGSLQEGVELNNKTQGAITYGLKLMYSVLKQKII